MPANDEQELLPTCLESLWASGRSCGLPVDVVVVLDGCTDDSAAVVEQFALRNDDRVSVRGVSVSLRNVGAARSVGVARLLEHRSARCPWIATTDADTEVPAHWFRAQLAHARAGATAVVGTVRVQDWDSRPESVRLHADAAYSLGEHHHIHGANLAFSTDAYLRAGGFLPLACHEDVALVRAFVAAGEPVVWATDLAVLTSGRRVGRTGSGFAEYLNDLELALEQEPA